MASLVLPLIRNDPSKIQLARISHVYQAHPDLEKWKTFAKDFGFEFVAETGKQAFYRGYGKDPYICVASQSTSGEKEFGGVAFLAKGEAGFEKASKLPGAQIVDLSPAPGGGTMVTIPIPSGSNVHVVFGQQERDAPAKVITATEINKGDFNTSFQKSRKGMLCFQFSHVRYAQIVCRYFPKIQVRSCDDSQVGTLRSHLYEVG
jgi:hypothetical protein